MIEILIYPILPDLSKNFSLILGLNYNPEFAQASYEYKAHDSQFYNVNFDLISLIFVKKITKTNI